MVDHPYPGGDNDGVKPVYMRYADILLMAAEIANSSGDENSLASSRDADYARSCLKKILRRAYDSAHQSEADAEIDALTSEEEIFNEIKKQRALEFVGEFLRKADLIRWNCLKTSMDAASDELNALRTGAQGAITGFNYGSLGDYLWYRYDLSGTVPEIEMYGIHADELTTSTTPPSGSGWVPYTNSAGEVSKYIDEDSFKSPNSNITDKAAKGEGGGFYDADPDLKQWWPIPEISIINSQEHLKNDYNY